MSNTLNFASTETIFNIHLITRSHTKSQIESTSFNQFSNEIRDSHLSRTDAQQDKYNQQNHLTHFNYTVLVRTRDQSFVDVLAQHIPLHMYNARTTTIVP